MRKWLVYLNSEGRTGMKIRGNTSLGDAPVNVNRRLDFSHLAAALRVMK